MKRHFAIILLSLCLALLPGRLNAQSSRIDSNVLLEELIGRLDSNRARISYRCTIDNGTAVNLSGIILLQGNCYYAEGNGLKIYCNGPTRWTVDEAEKEVYIENSDGIREVLQYRDSITDFSISELRYMEYSEDLSAFIFDSSKLSSDWVVTDLRD